MENTPTVQNAAIQQLPERSKILLKLASLCIEPLPEDFLYTEVTNRLWKAFALGKQYQKWTPIS